VEEEGVIRPSILDQPMHRTYNVRFRRLAHGILLVIRQKHHVFPRISEVSIEIRRHVLDIIYAAPQLTFLAEVVDSDQKRFASACAS